jgi:hypothetical protein
MTLIAIVTEEQKSAVQDTLSAWEERHPILPPAEDKFTTLFVAWLNGNMDNADGDTGSIYFVSRSNEEIAAMALDIFKAVQP